MTPTLRAGLLALVAWASAPAHAACSASTSAVVFGAYDPFAPAPRDSSGSVTVTCDAAPIAFMQSYSIALSTGASGSYADRRLTAGASSLQYQLHPDFTHTTVWGDGSAGTQQVGGMFAISLIVPVSAVHTVHGRMPAQQLGARSGSYGDTIVVTVSY